jgi:GT2 family glycosyltransferase
MVSAIVLAYNRCPEVLITIDKLKAYKKTLPFDFEIIVIDNASVDDTTKQVQERHSDITLLTKEKNNGIAGWNEGFKIARHKYFLVLDDDSHIEAGLVEAVDYLEQNDNVGILALNITGGSYETSEWKDKADAIGFIGCGAIIKREVYEKIGGFAEWLYVYGHEWEYGIRCINAGFKVQYFQNSNVVHRTSSMGRTNKRVRTFSTRNEMGIVYKYFAKNRGKYLLRVWLNSLKVIKDEGVSAAYYSFLGGIHFLKMRKQLEHTPVTEETQRFFADIFWGTQPVFDFIEKKFRKKS